MPLIEPGKKAPAFSLKDQDGQTHTLSDYAGRPVVLYFYPKDDTPGCTVEACAFRDNLPKFAPGKAAIFGVSILDEKSKAKFASKYDLNFPLLADADHVDHQRPDRALAGRPGGPVQASQRQRRRPKPEQRAAPELPRPGRAGCRLRDESWVLAHAFPPKTG